MLHVVVMVLMLGVRADPPAQPGAEAPELLEITRWEPGDPGFADMVVVIHRMDDAAWVLGRSAGVLVDADTLVVPLVMALGDALKVITIDCAPVEVEGVVGVDERAGLALLRLSHPPPNGRVPAPANEPVEVGDTVSIGAVFPIMECGFMTGPIKPAAVLSRQRWAGRGELIHIGQRLSLIGLASPLLTKDDRLQGVISGWGGAKTTLAVPVERINAIERHAPVPLAHFALDDLAPSTRARILASRAGEHRGNGEVAHAAQLAGKALALDPNCWLALYEAGVCADKRGDRVDAERLLRRAIAIEPGFSEAWCSLGLVLITGGDPAGAIAPFERAVAIDGRYAGALGMLAVAYMQTGDLERAVTLGERAIRADGLEPILFSNLMLMHERAGHAEDAIRVCRAWTEAFPDDGAAWASYASWLFDAEKWKACLAASQRAVELNEDDVLSYLHLAMSALTLGDRERARDAVNTVLDHHPNNPVAKYILELMSKGDG